MKTIAVTQRVDVIANYGERRDAIDQKWTELLMSMGFWPIIIPNSIAYLEQIIKHTRIDGVLLSGGNSLVSCGGNAPERDQVEKLLLKWAISQDIPVLGVCRGMQIIQEYFNNTLQQVTGHVASRHKLVVNDGFLLSKIFNKIDDVNSYNEYGSTKVTGDLNLVAKSEDDVVMAIEHNTKPVYGVMWHSERESPFNKLDKQIFQQVFK